MPGLKPRDVFQLQRSDLFLADKQEQVLSHSVVTYTNYRYNDFLHSNDVTGEVIPTGLFLSFAFRLRTDDPYGARNFRKKSDAPESFRGKLRFFITFGYLGFNPG